MTGGTIELIIDRIVERTIRRRDSILLKDILASEIPPQVRVYLRNQVIRWLHSDLRSAPRCGQLNRSVPGIEQLTQAFLRSLADAYEFQRADYLSLVDDAVRFAYDYVCRPQRTLSDFIFRGGPVLQADDVISRLDYTHDYAYFRRVIARAMVEWSWREVRKEDFRTLVARIDAQIVKQHSALELAMLARPIFDFGAEGDTPAHRAVPLDALLAFFDDKGLAAPKAHIEAACGSRGRSELTLAELGSMLGDLPAESPEAVSDRAGQAADAGTAAGRPGGAELPGADLEALVAELAPGHEASVPDAQTAGAAGSAGSSPAAGLPDLRDLIPEKSRARLIRKLFRKDADYYDAVIADLNAAPSWKDASSYLRDFFVLNKLDPFAEIVVEFTDLIHSRYGGSA